MKSAGSDPNCYKWDTVYNGISPDWLTSGSEGSGKVVFSVLSVGPQGGGGLTLDLMGPYPRHCPVP